MFGGSLKKIEAEYNTPKFHVLNPLLRDAACRSNGVD